MLIPPFPLPHSPGFHLEIHGKLTELQASNTELATQAKAIGAFRPSGSGNWHKGGDMQNQLQDFTEAAFPLDVVSFPHLVPQSHWQPFWKHEETVCLRMVPTCKEWKGRNSNPVTC